LVAATETGFFSLPKGLQFMLDNITAVRQWFDGVWNQRRAELIDEMLTEKSVCFSDDECLRGAEGFKEKQYKTFLSLFPDLQVEIEAMIAQDDVVVVRWKAEGVHSGKALGIEPTGKKTMMRGMTWIQVEDGKLAEGWQYSNVPQVLRNLANTANPG
jgi:steroid delta-isomerase-like uncharacterized protein